MVRLIVELRGASPSKGIEIILDCSENKEQDIRVDCSVPLTISVSGSKGDLKEIKKKLASTHLPQGVSLHKASII